MDNIDSSNEKTDDFCRCPHCPCCFCNETDLNRHIENYGKTKLEHLEAFRRANARLEHGAFNSIE